MLLLVTSALPGEGDTDPKPDASTLRLVTQRGHIYMIAVDFSPCGTLCVSGAKIESVAVLWDLATGRQLRRFAGHKGTVVTTRFTPSGDQVVTASRDGTARLWNTHTGDQLKVFDNGDIPIREAALTRDGSLVVLGGTDGTVSFWALGKRATPARFHAHEGGVRAVAVSPDGSLVLTGGGDGTAKLHRIETGAEVLRLDAHEGDVTSVAFSPDGKHLLTAGRDAVARLWNARTGAEEKTFRGHATAIWAARFSPDGRFVATGDGKGIWGRATGEPPAADNKVRLWDVATGAQLVCLEGHEDAIHGIAFSPDGSRLLTSGLDNTVRLWSRRSGELIRLMQGSSSPVWDLATDVSDTLLLTTGAGGSAHLWELPRGRIRGSLAGRSPYLLALALSADGRQAVTGNLVGPARLWDVASGTEIRRFGNASDGVDCVALSPSGDRVATGSRDNTARIWDLATGAELRRIDCGDWVRTVLFSPDGTQFATGIWSASPRLQLIAVEDGRSILNRPGHPFCFSPDGKSLAVGLEDAVEIVPLGKSGVTRRLVGHASVVGCGCFSADGRTLFTGSVDGEIRAWDVAQGQEKNRFPGYGAYGRVRLVVPAHGKWLAAGSTDGFVRFWSLRTGKELCRLIGFRDGGWAVMDPEGRYDASGGGDVEGLHWVVGNEPIALDQLKDRYYEPGLLAKVLGFNDEPLRDVDSFTAPRLYPAVKLSHADGRLRIRLTNRGGGIGKVVVMVNGKERTADARGPQPDAHARELTVDEDLSDDPRLLPGEENHVEVFAYNAEGYLRSRGFQVDFKVAGEKRVPRLWAVVAGVSDYGGEQLDLRFAAKDAEHFASALRLASTRFLGAERTHVTLLPDAKREELLEALTGIRAQSSDILVLYLAGHGVNHDDQFFFLTADARTANLQDPALRETIAISSSELTAAINASPALKQVLILDTCASGKLVKDLGLKRAVPASQVRALERVKDRTGMFVLAGCAADRVSYEATRYGQGLLTYSLLLGMKVGKLREEQYVDVSTLFNFAADKVPQFAKDIGGVQRPIVAQPRGGGSFDIGRLTDEDRQGLALRSVRPLFTRSRFFDRAEDDDVRDLAREVDALLKEASAGADARLNFVDVRNAEGAYRIAGSYTTDGDTLRVRFRVRGETDSEFLTVEGKVSDLAGLAKRIVAEAGRRVR